MISFNENLEACTGCDEDWNTANTLSMWYHDFNPWVKEGKCNSVSLSVEDDYIVPQSDFYSCLG